MTTISAADLARIFAKPSASWTERERTLVERHRRDWAERKKRASRAFFERYAAEQKNGIVQMGGDSIVE